MHATICMPWAFIVALWLVEDPTMGAYIATTSVATYAPRGMERVPDTLTPERRVSSTLLSCPLHKSEPTLSLLRMIL